MIREHIFTRKIGLLHLLAAALLLWSPLGVVAQEPAPDSYLGQEDLKNISLLSGRFHNASEDDARLARESLQMAMQSADRGNWAAAFKGYGESAVIRPSAEALAGLAVSISRISRNRESCADTQIAKLRDLSEAFGFLALAAEFGRIHDERIDLGEAHREIIETQQLIVDQAANCQRG